MALHVVPHEPALAPAVQAFNTRLAAGGIAWRFPEDPVPDWLPPQTGATTSQEYFVLTDGGEVRGGYCLRWQEVSIRGERHRAASFHLPVSEGTVNSAYSLVGTWLLRDAERREPRLFGVGMRGARSPVARLVRALGWPVIGVPFYFKICDGARVFRNVTYLRRGPLSAALLDLAARSGLASVGAWLAAAVLTRVNRSGAAVESVPTFGPWADAVWEAAAPAYGFCADRRSAALNAVYPAEAPGLDRLRVTVRGEAVGWAVIQDVTVTDHEHVGTLRLGTLVDGLAHPRYARAVVAAAVRALETRGVDLIASNQSHPAWRAGLRAAGCIRGPTTFLFTCAPRLAALLDAGDPHGGG
ncbi:MAG TPA: hypothetical protein VNN19_10495, partial [bacterium]|nr:hypothetical protein [bacterium]